MTYFFTIINMGTVVYFESIIHKLSCCKYTPKHQMRINAQLITVAHKSIIYSWMSNV